ncbi:hypothetical protein SAMN04489712_11021 [Thermomonospora echinospora]|uniref:Uncharacterized protein n=1 Tax=Thermomonospora echinospora TaxID=1992 RepID=A0A1H6CI02_9ACTN|nr:hypothetical protein [Thermomonospora echinospora]SEG72630.1 hypothetical protein SAMN04489712_11021 [Thermomonospora echinospora]
MRRRLVRWVIVAALIVVAGALPVGGPQRMELRDVPEALSFFMKARPGGSEAAADRRS